jgi:predicted AAA+ superfamily ATPase
MRLLGTLIEETRARLKTAAVLRDLSLSGIESKIEAVVGMRRSGKTYLLLQEMRCLLEQDCAEDAILYLNFEDDRLQPIDSTGAATLVDGFFAMFPDNHERRCHLFLDEVHAVEGWSRWLRRLHDTRDVKLYVTGSSAKLLSREIATELRGRSIATEVWPYSFAEYLRARELSVRSRILGQPTMDRLRAWAHEYLDAGGFPEVVTLDAWSRRRVLQDYVDVVVLRDVIERHGITNIALARYLTRLLLRYAGRTFSVNKTYNDLKSQGRKVGKTTLYEYLGYFEDAYLCFAVPLHESSARKTETAPRKLYAIDPGLVTAFQPEPTRDIGHLFENLIFLDLRRAGCDVCYYQTRSGFEVDFLATRPDRSSVLIQVCYDPSDEQTLNRERRALAEAEEELGLIGRLVTPQTWLEDVFELMLSTRT